MGEEQWKPIAGWEHYDVSDMGRVRSRNPRYLAKEARVMKPRAIPKGYTAVTLCDRGRQKIRYVHHLVLEAFVGPRPDGLEARHINGIPGDNRVCNLRWSTHSENESDKVAHGTALRGERHNMVKMTEDAVFDVAMSGETGTSLAKKYGVSDATISRIRNGVCWSHVTGIRATGS